MNFFKNTFIKFIIIGVISTTLNYLIFFVLYKFGINYLISSSLGYISGLILGYFLNKNFNFYLRNYKNTFIKYVIVYINNLIISILILSLLVEILNINVYISNFLILIYTTLANYIGIKYYVFKNKALLSIGIVGNSGCGKTTLSNLFTEILGQNNTSILNGDSSHKWERNDKNWNKLTHLNPKGNHLNIEKKNMKKIINGGNLKRKYYDHEVGKYTKSETINFNTFIIYEGLHGLYGKISNLFDIKVFIESDFELKNKIDRDIEIRNRNREKLLNNINQRKDDYKKYIFPQKENSNINYIEKDGNFLIKINFKNGVDKELENILNEIKGIIINNSEIEINKNYNYKISDNFLKKYGLTFILEFNKDIIINNSHKGVLKIILIYLIQKYASNNTNGMNLKKVSG